MNEDQYYDPNIPMPLPLPPNQQWQKPFDSDVEVSQSILSIKPLIKDKDNYLIIDTDDLPKANLPQEDLAFVRRGIIFAQQIRNYGLMHGIDMTTSANTITNEVYTWIISSRGKNFAASILSKTSIYKNENDTKQFIKDDRMQNKGFFGRLFGGR